MSIASNAEAIGTPGVPRKVGPGDGAWGPIRPSARPPRLSGFTDRRETPLGTLFLTLNDVDGQPFELFAQIGKAGSDVASFTEAVARLASLALRCGLDPAEIAEQLSGIGGSCSVGFGADRVRSVPDAIGRVLRRATGGRSGGRTRHGAFRGRRSRG